MNPLEISEFQEYNYFVVEIMITYTGFYRKEGYQ